MATTRWSARYTPLATTDMERTPPAAALFSLKNKKKKMGTWRICTRAPPGLPPVVANSTDGATR